MSVTTNSRRICRRHRHKGIFAAVISTKKKCFSLRSMDRQTAIKLSVTRPTSISQGADAEVAAVIFLCVANNWTSAHHVSSFSNVLCAQSTSSVVVVNYILVNSIDHMEISRRNIKQSYTIGSNRKDRN